MTVISEIPCPRCKRFMTQPSIGGLWCYFCNQPLSEMKVNKGESMITIDSPTEVQALQNQLNNIRRRLDALEGKQSPQPAPVKPQTLIEAVEKYFNASDTDNSFLSKKMNYHGHSEREAMRQALAVEKRRNQLIASLILVAKSHRNKADNLDRAIAALDAFERGAENG